MKKAKIKFFLFKLKYLKYHFKREIQYLEMIEAHGVGIVMADRMPRTFARFRAIWFRVIII